MENNLNSQYWIFFNSEKVLSSMKVFLLKYKSAKCLMDHVPLQFYMNNRVLFQGIYARLHNRDNYSENMAVFCQCAARKVIFTFRI